MDMQDFLPEGDLDFILDHAAESFAFLKGKRIFITGGTGLFGKWLLGAFFYAQKRQVWDGQLVVLSRNPAKFLQEYNFFEGLGWIEFLKGDIRDFPFPDKQFDFIIHAATEASAKLNEENPQLMLETIIEGTKRVLEFATKAKASRILLTSSGGIYGATPAHLDAFHEDYEGAPSPLNASGSAYGEGKRVSELLGAMHARQTGMDVLIARCFAFVGPHLPLDTHFAIGNFLRDTLDGKNIVIKGDGTPLRSYLYMSDLVIWLLKILCFGKSCRAYNVGSDHAVSIKETAEHVLKMAPELKIEVRGILDPNKRPARYLPNIERAKAELKLEVFTPLDLAIAKTFSWHKNRG